MPNNVKKMRAADEMRVRAKTVAAFCEGFRHGLGNPEATRPPVCNEANRLIKDLCIPDDEAHPFWVGYNAGTVGELPDEETILVDCGVVEPSPEKPPGFDVRLSFEASHAFPWVVRWENFTVRDNTPTGAMSAMGSTIEAHQKVAKRVWVAR